MNKSWLSALAVAVVAGFGIGFWLAGQLGAPDGKVRDEAEAQQPLFYRSPMNPAVTSPVPAKDEMGMDYIPVYADSTAGDDPAGTVQIDPVTVQNIGVRTARAERRTMDRIINTVGRVDYDERRLFRLHPKTEGWIEQLSVETTGERIRENTILLSIYSPQLVSTQQEYILALRSLETLRDSPFEDVRRGAEELVEGTLERLRLLDVPDHQIEELRKTREVKKLLHIHAPSEGFVTNIGVREGQYVTPRDQLYTIADFSRVWVYVDIYEDELPWVRVGNEAEMTVKALPGEVFRGRLTYVYPYAEGATRTVKVRMEFDNPGLLLKPDMFVNVRIKTSPREGVIAVPSEAVVRSGLRDQVFLVRAPGKFEPREVNTGMSGGGWTEIRDGLGPDDEVVVSAQFLIDSESKLREAAAKMMEPGQ